MSALRKARYDAEAGLQSLAKYKNFLLIIFITQVIIGFWSYKFWPGVINIEIVTLYIVMWAAALGIAATNEQKIDRQFIADKQDSISWLSRIKTYGLFFIGGWLIFGLLAAKGVINAGTLFAPIAFGNFVFHLAIVSPSESIFFHGIVPAVLKKNFEADSRLSQYDIILTFAISQGLFAMAHYAAYSGHVNISNLLFQSFLFGCLFLWLAWYSGYGLSAAMGIHSAWNWVIISGGGITVMNISFYSGAVIVLGLIALISFITFFKFSHNSRNKTKHGGLVYG